jgi:hypothetical protein
MGGHQYPHVAIASVYGSRRCPGSVEEFDDVEDIKDDETSRPAG